MENSPGPGPAPSVDAPTLPARRAAVLEAVASAPGPVTAAGLAGDLGVHVNTVREHLEALVAAALVERAPAPAHGRGRPAWTYAAVRPPGDDRVHEYGALAAALARHLARTSTDPARDAEAAGFDWGSSGALEVRTAAVGHDGPVARDGSAVRDGGGGRGGPDGGPGGETGGGPGRAPVDLVGHLLSRLGYDPVVEADDPEVVLLRRCPLLETARQYPHVVCPLHRGMVRGVLQASGITGARVRLEPFAADAGCRLEVRDGRDAR